MSSGIKVGVAPQKGGVSRASTTEVGLKQTITASKGTVARASTTKVGLKPAVTTSKGTVSRAVTTRAGVISTTAPQFAPESTNGTATLDDPTQSWSINQWAGYIVEILLGTGAGQFRLIQSNTATQLRVSGAWDTIPDTTSQYGIYLPQLLMTDYGLSAADDELSFVPPGYGIYYFKSFDWGGNEQTQDVAQGWTYTTDSDQESNITPRTSVVVDGRTKDGAASTTIARLTFQAHPTFTDYTTGISSGSNTDTTLNVAGTPWTLNQWQSLNNKHFFVRITAGTGVGQLRNIDESTSNQLILDMAWTANGGVIPDGTSTFAIQNGGTQYRRNGGNWIPVAQAEFLTRSPAGDLIEFYSVLNGAPAEPIKQIFLDADTIAEIGGVSAVETVANILDVVIDTPDDDVKYWRLYARRGSVAASVTGTSSGANSATTFNDTTKTWVLNQWLGYVIAITTGTGAAQVRVVLSNTVTQLTLEKPWTITPDATSTYKIYAASWPTANTERATNLLEQYLRGEFQSTLTSTSFSADGSSSDTGLWYIVVLPVNSFNDMGPALYEVALVDGVGTSDATIANLVVTKNDNGTTAYYNKIGWDHTNIDGTGGTSSGSNTSTTLNDTSKSWTTSGGGQWVNYRVEIVSGTGVGQSRTVSSNTATQLTISPAWTTTPGATSKYEVYSIGVLVMAYRDDEGPDSEVDLTGGVYRNPRQDVDTDFANANDTDAVAAKGGYIHDVVPSQRVTGATGTWRVWYYTVRLYKAITSTPVLLTSYQVLFGDYYVEPVPVISSAVAVLYAQGGAYPSWYPNYGGQCTSPHRDQVSWTVQAGTQNDADYRIDVYDSTGTPVLIAQGVSTYNTSYTTTQWGILVANNGGFTYSRTYTIKVVRKSDGAIMQSIQSTSCHGTLLQTCTH